MIDKIGKECCGCSECVFTCPQNCISMKKNNEGFLYPEIDKARCTECNICEMKCPVANQINSESIKSGFIVRNKDDYNLSESAAGGFFSALVNSLKTDKFVFCGATYNEEWRVVHKISDSTDELMSFVGSKYVQSYIGDGYKKIKEYLYNDYTVVFCGTPCQVQALKKFLGPVDNNVKLFTVDFLCKGVGSPGVWKKYLEYQSNLYKAEIESINFRKKIHGYHSSNMFVKFKNGKVSSKSKTDLFMRSYVNELCSRESCYNCKFKGIDRCSDFTVFDAWHAKELITNKDDDKGYTTVVAHNSKAQKHIKNMGVFLDIFEIDIERAIELDGRMMNNQPIENEFRSEFLELTNVEGLNVATLKYNKVTYKDKTIELLKDILYKMKILNLVKSIKNKMV